MKKLIIIILYLIVFITAVTATTYVEPASSANFTLTTNYGVNATDVTFTLNTAEDGDSSAPRWIDIPANASLEENLDALSVDFNESDANFDNYYINDTTNFAITSSGVLTNNSKFENITYYVIINITDTSGNVNTTTWKADVTNSTPIVNVILPVENDIYNDGETIYLNFSTHRELQYCWYEVNENGTEISLGSSGEICEQGLANVSTACGGLSTGNYNHTGDDNDIENVTDGDFSTGSPASADGFYYLYINYSKPSGYLNSSFLEVKDGDYRKNLTINSSNCWNKGVLAFRLLVSFFIPGDGDIEYWCMNGSAGGNFDWYELSTSGTTYEFYEGKMWWNISSALENTTFNTIINGTNNVTVRCNNSLNSIGADTVNFDRNITDPSAPKWDDIPSNKTFEFLTDQLSVQFNATDASTITFAINDTDNFEINSATGVLINNTALSLRNYYIIVTATDSKANANTTTWNMNVTDTHIPILYIPKNQSLESKAEGISVDFNYTDKDNVTWHINDTVRFAISVTGVLSNITGTDNGRYHVNVIVNDSSDNQNSTIFELNVTDTKAPRIDDIPKNKSLEFFVDKLKADFNASDGNFDNYYVNDTQFAINVSGILTNVTTSVGEYYINVTFNDTSDNKNWTIFNVNISDTRAPRLDDIPGNKTIEVGSGSLSVDFNASDPSNISYYYINFTSNFTIDSSGVLSNTTKILYRAYTIKVSVNDTYNHTNTTVYQFNRTDTVTPKWVDIPENKTLEFTIDPLSVEFNATDFGEIDTYYTNHSGNFSINASGVLINETSLAAGTFSINVSVNDTAGNINSTQYIVIVSDTRAPRLTYPENATLEFNYDFLSVDFNATDPSALGTWTINQSGNFTINSGTGVLINATRLAEGIYGLNVTINDTYGNLNSSLYYVNVSDTIYANCSMLSVTPADIEANSTGTFEFIVNCTDPSGINTTKVGDHYRSFFTITVDDNGSLPNYWSAFYPPNNLAQKNGYTQQIFRAVGRNESYWYEGIGQPELDANVYDYAVYDGEYGHFKIESSGDTWATYNISGPLEHLIFKISFPLNKENMFTEDKKEYEVRANNGMMVLFYDLETIKSSVNYTLIAQGNFNYTTTPSLPNKNMLITYCNQSYLDVTCSGNFSNGCTTTPQDTDDYCVFINALPYTALDTRKFSEENSSYVSDVYGITDNTIGGIKTTNISYVYYRSRSTTGSFTIRYANGTSGIDNISFANSSVAFYTTDDGSTFLPFEGTPDIHLNVIKDGDQLQMGGCNYDLAAVQNMFCSYNFYNDNIGDVNFPISAPSIKAYLQGIQPITNHTGDDEDLNGTYYDNMSIHIGSSIDSDEPGTVKHILYLENPDGSDNLTINSSFYSPDDSDNSVHFDTNLATDGYYKMNVTAIADDDASDIRSDLSYNNFTIDNIGPRWVDIPSNKSVDYLRDSISIDFNATDLIGIHDYATNHSSNFSISSTGVLTNITPLRLGTYTLNVSVNDTFGRVNWTIWHVNATNLNPPNILAPSNKTLEFLTDSLSVDFNATNTSALDTWSTNHTSNFSISSTGILTNATNLTIGIYIINVSINDTSGNYNSTIWNVNVTDTLTPKFTGIPNNISREYYVQGVSLDFNATDKSPMVWYQNNTANFTISVSGVLSNTTILNVSRFTLNITVNDTSNNKNNTMFQINISDTTAPYWNTIAPNLSITVNRTSVSSQFSAGDFYGLATWTINDTTYLNISQTGLVTNVTNLEVGMYYVNISINDSFGNINWTIFKVSSVSQAMNLSFDGVSAANRKYEFKTYVNISSDYPSTYCFTVFDNTSRYINYSCGSAFYYYIDKLLNPGVNYNITNTSISYNITIENKTDLIEYIFNITGYDSFPSNITIDIGNDSRLDAIIPGYIVGDKYYINNYIYSNLLYSETNLSYTSLGSKLIYLNITSIGDRNSSGFLNFTINAFDLDDGNEFYFPENFSTQQSSSGVLVSDGINTPILYDDFNNNITYNKYNWGTHFSGTFDEGGNGINTTGAGDLICYAYSTDVPEFCSVGDADIDLRRINQMDIDISSWLQCRKPQSGSATTKSEIGLFGETNEVFIPFATHEISLCTYPDTQTASWRRNYTIYWSNTNTITTKYSGGNTVSKNVGSLTGPIRIVLKNSVTGNDGFAASKLNLHNLNVSGISINRSVDNYNATKVNWSSGPIYNASNNIDRARFVSVEKLQENFIGNLSANTDITYWMSNDGEDTWEVAVNSTAHAFESTGKNLSMRIEFETNNTLVSPLITDLLIEVVPTGGCSLNIDIGELPNGSKATSGQDMQIKIGLNSTNTPLYYNGTDLNILNFPCLDQGLTCNVPIRFTVNQSCVVEISDINYSKSINPLNFTNLSGVEALKIIPTSFNITKGRMLISDSHLQYYGSKNITVKIYDNADINITTSNTIEVKYSHFNITYPSGQNYWVIEPTARNQTGIPPYGQNSTHGIWQLTSQAYDSPIDLYVRYNETIDTCVLYDNFTSTFSTEYCYQESTNRSNYCSKDTGEYASFLFSGIPSEVSDSHIFMNYTKPANVYGAIWQTKHGNLSTYNSTIISDCFDTYSTKLVLRFALSTSNQPYKSVGQCFNGSVWKNTTNYTSGATPGGNTQDNLYKAYDGDYDTYTFPAANWRTGGAPVTNSLSEEAIFWDFSNATIFNAKSINVSLNTSYQRFVSGMNSTDLANIWTYTDIACGGDNTESLLLPWFCFRALCKDCVNDTYLFNTACDWVE